MSLHRISTADQLRICSGQVITDLTSSVKELLENALDAGARIVEIKLHNKG